MRIGVVRWEFYGFVSTDPWGKNEEARQDISVAGARNPNDTAYGVVDILEGKRDSDNGGFLHKDGIHLW